jgi:hypothetical protein
MPQQPRPLSTSGILRSRTLDVRIITQVPLRPERNRALVSRAPTNNNPATARLRTIL